MNVRHLANKLNQAVHTKTYGSAVVGDQDGNSVGNSVGSSVG
mgnify:CR=1 FL=1